MSSLLITIFAALTVIILIVLLGLLLTRLIIRRTEKTQIHTDVIPEQSPDVVIDIDELPEAQCEPEITVISNDVIKGVSRHQRLRQNTLSVIDSDAQINPIHNQTTEIEQKRLTIPTSSDSTSVSTRINPLTGKITLEY